MDLELQEFSELWDGTWVLHRFQQTLWQFKITFGQSDATLRDIQKLRSIFPELNRIPIALCLKRLRNSTEFLTEESFGNIEMLEYVESLNNGDIAHQPIANYNDHYVPANTLGHTMVIEDDSVAKKVFVKMLAEGVEVITVGYAD